VARCGESESRAAEEEGLRVLFNKRVAPMPLLTPTTEGIKPENIGERAKIAMALAAIPLITTEDIKSESFGEKAKVVVYTSTEHDKVREMKSDYSHLRFGSEEQRGTPGWNDEALQFLNKLERWSRELGQPEREFFFQRAEWYGALVYAAPDGKLRQLFLDRYVKFLTSSPVERESPPEWVMWVNRLIGAAEIPDRSAWVDQIERAGDSAVAVYCQLARLRLETVH
jgi:hypothetical protein